MIILQQVTYIHPNKDVLFDNLSFIVNSNEKIALIGNNGVGKSTLLKIIAKELLLSDGHIKIDVPPYYIPQIFGQFNHLSIAEALGIDKKLYALSAILAGNTNEDNFSQLEEDWTIEERCQEALSFWGLSELDLNQKLDTLSGGQKTKVFLAGILIHQPKLILLDEPTNHLDALSREKLYLFLEKINATILLVSHDRKLLNTLSIICEMSKTGITYFGGNYDFYLQQKELINAALNQDIQGKEKALRKAKEKEKETLQRQQKLDSRGKSKQEKAGMPRIMMNTLKNNAENSTAKIKSVHTEKIGNLAQDLQDLRLSLPDIAKMKIGFENTNLHKGKVLFTATNINVEFQNKSLWLKDLSLQILSGERISIKGANGTGKTTLIKIILRELQPVKGVVESLENDIIYIDQDYSLINNSFNVYEQAQSFNVSFLQEYEVKTRLNRFLFTKDVWDKPCYTLSGGERMRLLLCCLTITNKAPDIIILDEPTNNLDIQNIEILTKAVSEYQGTLIVVSHDQYFLQEIRVEKTINL